MTPEEIAARHPRLYHVTSPAALPGILRHGLLPAQDLVALFGCSPAEADRLLRDRRPATMVLRHPLHGEAWLTDNAPLSLAALERCLEDGLTPAEWLAMLNARVFLWPDRTSVQSLVGARLNRSRDRVVLVLDTLELLRRHGATAEVAPINTGSTIRSPARRGLSTFTPLGAFTLEAWRRRRGGRDTIREVAIRGPVPAVDTLLLATVPAVSGRLATALP